MGIELTIDREIGVIFSLAKGDITPSDLQANREEMLAHPDYTPELDRLFDGWGARLSFTGEEAHRLAQWSIKHKPVRRAALVLGKRGMGFGRMFHGWVGDAYPIAIFEDMAPAREWLGLPPEG